jgi:hypothetical protein
MEPALALVGMPRGSDHVGAGGKNLISRNAMFAADLGANCGRDVDPGRWHARVPRVQQNGSSA